ncbi:MAG: ABC transporter ATP-binding protein [Planctomycetes bacterium]|nr:ABC transporter ATP-binding protein [Planctomycetota bacterium]
MLRYRGRLVLAITNATLAAVCFAFMMIAVFPVLRVILKQEKSMPEYFREVDADRFFGFIPDVLINALPEDLLYGAMILVGTMVTVGVIGSICKIIGNYLAFVVCIRSVADLRVDVVGKMMELPLLTLLGEPVAERVSRVMRDSSQLVRGFTSLMGRTMGDLMKGVAALVVAFIADWRLALASMLLAPVLVLYYKMHGRKVRRLSRRVLEQAAKMLHTIEQSLRGLRVVKVHTAEAHEVERFEGVTNRFLAAEYPLRWRKSVASPTIEIITTIGFGCLAVFAAWSIGNGLTDGTKVTMCVFALAFAATTLRQFTFVYNEIFESAAAADRLAEIIDLAPEDEGDEQRPELSRLTTAIEFDDVTFQYPTANRPSLEGISLTVEKGKMVAFVGPNGSGKSTLLSLVPRIFDPTSGRILVDGQSIKYVTMRSLRDQIGVVTQETVLFHDTIAANIAYGQDDVSREQVEEVARRAYADDFISRKPHGYDTMVGDQGLTLSGGERQRVAIARAILRDPAILILDEATSMIDAESEALITAALDEFCHARTSLVIAHRLSTVVNADQIVVLDMGRIVDKGTHDELLSRCELYQQLCRTQLVEHADTSGDGGEQEAAKVVEADDPIEEVEGMDLV